MAAAGDGLFYLHHGNPVIMPPPPPPLTGSKVTDAMMISMEGIYTVSSGKERFGEEVSLKWNGKKLSIFSQTNYAILSCVYQGSDINMQGYWRVPTSDETGLITLAIAGSEGGSEIISGNKASVIMRGGYGNGNGPASLTAVFQYKRDFSAKVLAANYLIVGHRGGGRTSDRLPISENTPAMIGYTANFGSNGIEIDVRLTSDKVPVLYHDSDINIRLTTKSPLNGPIGNFTYGQLLAWVRLIRGEKIPTLEEALTYTVDSTRLKFVWLDMKDEDPDLVKYVVPIQQAAIARAQSKGRNLKILMGVPTQGVFDALKATPSYQSIPSLCELSPEGARELSSQAWGPRWTLGTQNDLVASVQGEGRLVLTWTIDSPNYIKQYIQQGRFNGLLSNYPSYVAYEFYRQE